MAKMTDKGDFLESMSEVTGIQCKSANKWIIARFRSDGAPCTWRQLKTLEEEHGEATLDLIEILEDDELFSFFPFLRTLGEVSN
jgi:hypothetical protein